MIDMVNYEETRGEEEEWGEFRRRCSSDKGEGVKTERAWERKCLILKKEKNGTKLSSNQRGWRWSRSTRLSTERKV